MAKETYSYYGTSLPCTAQFVSCVGIVTMCIAFFFFVVVRIQINMYCVLVFLCVCVALYLDSGVLCCVSVQRCVVLYNVITFYLYSVVCLYSVVKRVVKRY